MDGITLPPELERYAAEAMSTGRYRDISAVVQAGLSLLRQSDAELPEFVASLEDARAEGERDGFLTATQVETRVPGSDRKRRRSPPVSSDFFTRGQHAISKRRRNASPKADPIRRRPLCMRH